MQCSDGSAVTAKTCTKKRDVRAELFLISQSNRGTQRQFSENICSEDDLRSGIFGAFVVKFLACLPLLGFSFAVLVIVAVVVA